MLLFLVLVYQEFFILYRLNKRNENKSSAALQDAIKKARATAQKIELEFDKCEFKNGTYTHEAEDKALSVITHLAPYPFASFAETIKIETRVQSRLVCKQTITGKEHRFVSQLFPFDITTLQYYVITKKVILYIDRFDTRKYWFEKVN